MQIHTCARAYNRLQCVCCNGVFSDLEVINFGVPQGSNLGPLLFTHNVEDKQFMLQVIEANREAVPTESTMKCVIDALTVTHE